MDNLIAKIAIITLLVFSQCHYASAQNGEEQKPVAALVADSAMTAEADSAASGLDSDTLGLDYAEAPDSVMAPVETVGFHKMLKTKYIEGSAGFMSFVALALVLGLAFCIERIIYLTLSEINAKRLMADLETQIMQGDVEGAKTVCRETRGPVASICYQGLTRIDESMEDIDEQIQQAGDISPTIVAAGMKVALITTIFGLIAALILQVFYNYILSKIEHITSQMEESAITLLDIIMKYKLTR